MRNIGLLCASFSAELAGVLKSALTEKVVD
jgi:hypothetical protein